MDWQRSVRLAGFDRPTSKMSLDAGSSFSFLVHNHGVGSQSRSVKKVEEETRAVWGLARSSAPIGCESPYAVPPSTALMSRAERSRGAVRQTLFAS